MSTIFQLLVVIELNLRSGRVSYVFLSNFSLIQDLYTHKYTLSLSLLPHDRLLKYRLLQDTVFSPLLSVEVEFIVGEKTETASLQMPFQFPGRLPSSRPLHHFLSSTRITCCFCKPSISKTELIFLHATCFSWLSSGIYVNIILHSPRMKILEFL